MSNDLMISIDAILPMFLIVAVGVLMRYLKVIEGGDVKKLNSLTFKVFLPLLLFSNLYGKVISENVDGKPIIYAVSMAFGVFCLAVVICTKIEKDKKKCGALIHAVFRSNIIILGIPIVINLYGVENLTIPTIMITSVVALYNVLAVVLLEVFRGEKPKAREIVTEVIKNPLLIGVVAGAAFMVGDIKLPVFLESAVLSMADAATPLALVVLGASFSAESVERCRRNLIMAVTAKLIIVPAVGISGGILLGFRGIELATLVAVFASPTAIASYTMAQQMDSDHELAGNAVIFSSGLSVITMFLWVFALRSMEMI